MLHAISKGKTGIYKRYLGKRDDDSERKIYEEDEITSTLLGPLDFLPTQDVYRFWCDILSLCGHSNFLLKTAPIDVQIKFWGRRKQIEPDALVTIKYADGQFRMLLIEMKWRADLSGKDQLHKQWKQFLNEDERKNSLHIFIAPEISAGASALADEDVWASKLVLIPWLKIRTVLDKLSSTESEFGRWAQLTNYFLQKVGIEKFSGFKHIEPTFTLPQLKYSRQFWIPHVFSGWNAISMSPSESATVHLPIFFDNF